LNWTLAFGLGCFALGTVVGPFQPEPKQARIYPAPDCRPAMDTPVEWSISVTQSGPGTETKTRYYKAERR
jgi:hypothetical protein